MSVNFNLISAVLSEEDHGTIITNVKGIESLLPFAITLPAEEKLAMPGVGVQTIDFISKSFDYAVKNPELPPNYLDMAEFGRDVTLAIQLQILMNHLVPLVNKLSDTYALVACEAYSASRIFYHHVKNAAFANVPGASAIAKELGKRFKVSKSTGSSSDNGQPPALPAPVDIDEAE
ncbi:MAG: hypothetical protein GY950_11410 [bacterium]|nr:hypothetical protein [bacterium]